MSYTHVINHLRVFAGNKEEKHIETVNDDNESDDDIDGDEIDDDDKERAATAAAMASHSPDIHCWKVPFSDS